MQWAGLVLWFVLVAGPAEGQRVVPSDSLTFQSGAQLRVQLGFRDRIEGRFVEWVGDTIAMQDRLAGRVAVDRTGSKW